jgi:hypothetical protein
MYQFPFQEPDFDPGDGQLLAWAQKGTRLTGLILNLTVFEREGAWYIVISDPIPEPGHPFLAYPLPKTPDGPELAGLAFYESFRVERNRLKASRPPRNAPEAHAPRPTAQPKGPTWLQPSLFEFEGVPPAVATQRKTRGKRS